MSLSFVQNRTHCLLCKNTYETRGAMKHLRACLRKQPDPPPDSRPPTMVSVHGDHPDKNNAYAVYLVFEHGSTLSDLDIYLRATWLECCFHLSLFRDLDTLYLCPEWPPEPICEPNIQFMHTPISNAIAPGDQAQLPLRPRRPHRPDRPRTPDTPPGPLRTERHQPRLHRRHAHAERHARALPHLPATSQPARRKRLQLHRLQHGR